MTITAKFASVCPNCNGRITPGTKVEWSKGSKARHVTCTGTGTPIAQSSTAGRYPRPLVNGDVYTGRNGNDKVFGCGTCSRLGRMCKQCQFDEYDM